MSEKVESFYQELKDLKANINKRTSKTVADNLFKSKVDSLYERWKVEIRPLSEQLGANIQYSKIDRFIEELRAESDKRQAETSVLQFNAKYLVDSFFDNVIVVIKKNKPLEPTKELMDSAKFLGLDTNWSIATCALQLQEVSIKLVAGKLAIDLSQTNVEKILNSKVQPKDFGFNQQYEAFQIEVKRLSKIDMPEMTTHFRRMRVKVLHEGYNPQKEETDAIASFTIGLMSKLENICEKMK